MNIGNSYNTPSFQSRCAEIRLGQQVCHLVNTEFPHYSLFKFKPMIDKNIAKTSSPVAITKRIMLYNQNRPGFYDPISYIPELFSFINKFKSFDCNESALLGELILKLNGFKNSYTALMRDGGANFNHVLCLFNRDGSELKTDNNGAVNIENNKTIIVDPWANICDFANNALKEYHGFWDECLKPSSVYLDKATGEYNIARLKSMELPQINLNNIKEAYPNLIVKSIP